MGAPNVPNDEPYAKEYPPFKWCPRCQADRPIEAFRDHYQKGKKYKQAYCLPCGRLENKEHTIKRRDKARALAAEAMAGGCVDCGETDLLVLEFDHCRGEKVCDVSKMLQSRAFDAIRVEIAKCDVVCANCHRRRTYLRADNWRVQFVTST